MLYRIQNAKVVRLVAAAALAFALSAAAVYGYQSRADSGGPPVPPNTPGPPLISRSVPTVDASDLALASGLLSADLSFQKIAPRGGYRVLQQGAWHTSRGAKVLGVAMTVQLAEPYTGQMNITSLIYDESESVDPPYHVYTVPATVTGMTSVDVFVDSRRRQVVGLMPSIDTKVTLASPGDPAR